MPKYISLESFELVTCLLSIFQREKHHDTEVALTAVPPGLLVSVYSTPLYVIKQCLHISMKSQDHLSGMLICVHYYLSLSI